MKLAYHGATSMNSDLETDVKATAKAGFKALELWAAKIDEYLKTHSLVELASLLKNHSVEPASINSIEFIAFRGDGYVKIQDRLKQLCEISAGIDNPKIVVVPSPTPRTDGGDPNFAWSKVVDEYVAVLRDMSDIAKPFGVGLCFEFLGFGWCSVRTPKGAAEIVRKVARDNVGINFDSCHFYGGGGEMNEIGLLDPNQIYTLHLNDLEDLPKEAITDANRLLPGLGVINLAGICSHLQKIGYDGCCSIELFRPEYWAWDPYKLAVESRKAAVAVLSPYFHLE
jgi:2-keto-myo-inositol isomerase